MLAVTLLVKIALGQRTNNVLNAPRDLCKLTIQHVTLNAVLRILSLKTILVTLVIRIVKLVLDPISMIAPLAILLIV